MKAGRLTRTPSAKVRGEFAAGGDAVAGAEIAGMDQGAELIAELYVEWNVAFGLKMQRKHWLAPVGQYTGESLAVKSQFVFGGYAAKMKAKVW